MASRTRSNATSSPADRRPEQHRRRHGFHDDLSLSDRTAWRALAGSTTHAISPTDLRTLFDDDPGRGERLTRGGARALSRLLQAPRHRRDAALLLALAEESRLRERIDAMFAGEQINVSEDRSVLHVALRMPREQSLIVDGVDVVAEVHDVLDRMAAFADAVRAGAWRGFTGEPIRNVVNIGIGGSDLGPVMAYEALRHYSRPRA